MTEGFNRESHTNPSEEKKEKTINNRRRARRARFRRTRELA